MDSILKEIKVLELASVLAGPSVGQFFAELGAEVIKVENPAGGDVTRSWKSAAERTDDRSAYFSSVNWGKKSVALDLRDGAQRKQLHQLAAAADIVIASYKPGDAERLQVDYATLSQLNPAIIYGQITGYGEDNEHVGYDAIIQAESGFMDMNGEAGGPPIKMPVALVDVLAAHHLKEGILVALLQRERTGKGSKVEVSLLHAALASLANQATNWLVAGTVPERKGSLHPNIAPYGEVFETKDGRRVLLAVGSDRQFADLCALLGEPAWASDERFKTNVSRVQHRVALGALLAPHMQTWDAEELMARMHEKKIPAGFIQSVKEAFEMPEAQALLLQGGGLTGVRNYAVHRDALALSPPPHLGEHTEEILARLR